MTIAAGILLMTAAFYPRYWAAKEGADDAREALEIMKEVKRERLEFQKELQKPMTAQE